MCVVLSITTVPEPLSAGLIIMSCRFCRLRNACRSYGVKLSVIWLRLEVIMSLLIASMYALSAESLCQRGEYTSFYYGMGYFDYE